MNASKSVCLVFQNAPVHVSLWRIVNGMQHKVFSFFHFSVVCYQCVYKKITLIMEGTSLSSHKRINTFRSFTVHLCWYNALVCLLWSNALVRLCVYTHRCILFYKMHWFQTCFLFWRSVIYLDNILIAFVFNVSGCLLIKIHGMSSMNKKFSQTNGITSRITKQASGSY